MTAMQLNIFKSTKTERDGKACGDTKYDKMKVKCKFRLNKP